MSRTRTLEKLAGISAKTLKHNGLLAAFLFGLLIPLSFAPFHFPGTAILGLALFYAQLKREPSQYAFLNGLFFGLGYFGLGISWVYVSIHEFGHLNSVLSSLITLSFTLYLSLFTAFFALIFRKLLSKNHLFSPCLLFSALWVLFEYFRATLFSGFPWLLLGFGQFDAPTKYLLPIFGVYGVGFLTCFAAALLATAMQLAGIKRLFWLISFVALLLAPLLLKQKNWSVEAKVPLSVGIIQANLSMRDKWDEHLFWRLLEQYQQQTEGLLGTELIVMPESAIPLPPSYVVDFLGNIQLKAKKTGSAILLGIPEPATVENYYFNSMISLGKAKGSYQKQHLVPFGEYIPQAFHSISERLAIPDANLTSGKKNQPLIKIQGHAIASLICYELAYGDLLRHQLPQAEWIVSISDDGWFGHSLAMYQQRQMAQVRSLQTARYQVVANNDGLSAMIDTHGKIIDSLPAFEAGNLKTSLLPATGTTPWIDFGDLPVLLFCSLLVLICSAYRLIKPKVNH